MRANNKQKLVVPNHIISTLRKDVVLWSNLEKVAYFIELTVPWKDRVEEAYELKKAKYAELVGEAAHRGWSARLSPVKVGCCDFVAKSTVSLLNELDIRGQNLRHTVENMSLAAERASEWLWP